jgi:hypothetical protein
VTTGVSLRFNHQVVKLNVSLAAGLVLIEVSLQVTSARTELILKHLDKFALERMTLSSTVYQLSTLTTVEISLSKYQRALRKSVISLPL